MSFNRYIQYLLSVESVSAICGIYQQRILQLKELNWEGGKEREGKKEGGKIKTKLYRPTCKLTAHRSSKSSQLVYLLLTKNTHHFLKNMHKNMHYFLLWKKMSEQILLFLIHSSQFSLHMVCSIVTTLHSINICVNL